MLPGVSVNLPDIDSYFLSQTKGEKDCIGKGVVRFINFLKQFSSRVTTSATQYDSNNLLLQPKILPEECPTSMGKENFTGFQGIQCGMFITLYHRCI